MFIHRSASRGLWVGIAVAWLCNGMAHGGEPVSSAQAQIVARTVTTPAATDIYQAAAFADVPGWPADDHTSAFTAFRRSCARLIEPAKPAQSPADRLLEVCARAADLPAQPSPVAARAFFEQNFIPHRVRRTSAPGLLTAYYEPVVPGARSPSKAYPVPLHRRPADLVNLVDEADRASKPAALTHARQTGATRAPYATRQDIDQGALANQNLELFYVADEVERFFLQVQGSGIIQLPDLSRVRITYDGKNGHPYTSVGRHLIDTGVAAADQMSLEKLGTWLRADPERGRRAMWQNKSYVFFREMPGASAPIGVLGVPLTPLRSLAIDPAFHTLGAPIFVDAPDITHITGKPFRHLMIGQDVGSAIRGPERGDIFAGSGTAAGRIAGITKHPGTFFVLLPKPLGDPAPKP